MNSPNDRIGPYRLLRPIGSGGSGRVFAAIHEHMDQEVALKILSEESAQDPQLVGRLVQEARALARLQHPGVVRIHACEKLDDGTVYLAMEYLKGITLRTWLQQQRQQQGGPALLEPVLHIGRLIAEAMVEVHAQGIVHRDLKPENIVLAPDDSASPGFRPKILDFGIAKMAPPKSNEHVDTHVQTAAHSILGTSAYMAPEQCKTTSDVTDRADVYALGVVVFELIAGRPPFISTEDIELITSHVHDEPPHLNDLVATVPPALSAFVASMLAKAPEQRPTMARCGDMFARAWQTDNHECPFPGLQPFTEAQAELYFGRDAEIRDLVGQIEEMRDGGAKRWLQIEGHSGAGKSSLVQAGILPRLNASSSTKPRWLIVTLRPSEDPITSLASALSASLSARGIARSTEEIASALRLDEDALHALLPGGSPPGAATLFVVEQLEELFALGSAHLQQFDALLARSLSRPTSPLRLLTTLRSDYIHRLEQTPGLARLLNSTASRYHLRPMGEEALTQVIRGMAARAGLRLADGLAERMVRDAAGTDGRLPLLGHTLRSLWSPRAAAVLTHEDYDRVDGVSGALARHAAALLDALGDAGRERAKWLILDLVQVGRGAPDTRRPRTQEQVLAAAGGDALAEEVLLRLSGIPIGRSTEASEILRLVVLTGDPSATADQQRVDLVHETLLQRVPTIVGWIDAERALLERHADLEVAAHAWERSGSPKDGLPSGSLLDHYRGGLGDARQRARLLRMASERGRRFLRSAEALERQRLRVRRAFAVVLGAAVMGISATALWASRERARAEQNRQHIILATRAVVDDQDWKLSRLLYTSEIRHNLLSHIDENLASLREEEKDAPEVIEAVVKTKQRRADFARSSGRLSESYAFIAQAEGAIERGLKKDPSNAELLKKLALNYSKRGKIELARGNHERARADFAESVAILRKIRHVDDEDDYRRSLATSRSEQADVDLELGDAASSAARYQEAVQLLEQNVGHSGTLRPYAATLVASTLRAYGNALRATGDRHAAATSIEKARQMEERLVQAEPANAYFRLILGEIYVALAAVRAEEQQGAEALRLLEQATAIGEELTRGEESRKEYGLLLCTTLRGVEVVALDRGAPERAASARERRCAVVRAFVERDPEDVRFKRLACP